MPDLLSVLKFAKGAVARKEYVPSLTHFKIGDGKILGYNGAIAISSPIDIDINCSPKAVPFIKAIETCKETVKLYLTSAKKLAIVSGNFTSYIDCLPEDKEFPSIGPEGDISPLDGYTLLKALRTLEPFVGEDASRPWVRGVLLRDQSAFATNNIILIEKWVGANLPSINIPAESVAELIRIKEPPSQLQIAQGSITFHYEDGRWLRSQLLSTEWPDVARVFDRESTPVMLPPDFFTSLEDLVPFLGEFDRCYINADKVSTEPSGEVGASLTMLGCPEAGCFNLKQLLLLSQVIEKADFTTNPGLCLFFGDNLRGVMTGIRI